MLTCDRCLSGDTQRCRRGDCARYERAGAVRPPSPRRSSWRPTGNAVGRPPEYTAAQRHEWAVLLVVGSSLTAVAEHFGVGRDTVRRTRLDLEALAADGITAGPVVAVALPSRRHLSGFATAPQPRRNRAAA